MKGEFCLVGLFSSTACSHTALKKNAAPALCQRHIVCRTQTECNEAWNELESSIAQAGRAH